MYKKIVSSILVCLILVIGVILNISYATEANITNDTNSKFHKVEALSIPEKDINLKIENLAPGARVYLLLPDELFNYNLEKFINNNINNDYDVEKRKAEDLKKFYDEKDYIGYIEYFKELGFDINENEIELRHYCFSINETTEIIGYENYNDTKYIKLNISLNKNNEFKLIMKDYLLNYDCSKIKFLIDEYGTKTYISVSDYPFAVNSEKNSINECNINYQFYSTEDYEAINRSIFIAYAIIFIIIFLTVLCIIIYEIKKHQKHKKEIEERLFWKKKPTKEEKNTEKERIKNEIKSIKNKRKHRKK